MARTAPAPNLIAIPGMNPGNIVAGGGGGAGGGSGKGGKGGGGDGSGSTEDGGEDAGAGSKDAGACGAGSGAGNCPTHDEHATAGDPVDAASGNVLTIPMLDLYLPGFIPLRLERSYSTAARRADVGLGHGWSHSLSWGIESKRRALILHTDDGRSIRFPHIKDGASHVGRGGWLLARRGNVYQLETDDAYLRLFDIIDGAPFHPLSEMCDRYANKVLLEYRGTTLHRIVDSVGREVEVVPHSSGRIHFFRVRGRHSVLESPRYEYSQEGDLIEVLDPDGFRTTYTYEHHRMRTQTDGTGLRFYYRYDKQGRCIETWGNDTLGRDLGLGRDVPDTLADGSRAKGVHHCRFEYGDGFTNVINSVRIDMIDTNEFGKAAKMAVGGLVTTKSFDRFGNLREATDAAGAKTEWERDQRGRILKIVDPLGGTTQFERDSQGDIIGILHPDRAKTVVVRDANGGVIGGTRANGIAVSRRRAREGMVQENVDGVGQRTRFEYDGHWNLAAIVQPSGARWTFAYDEFGRPIAHEKPDGGHFEWLYSPGGRLAQERLPNGHSVNRVLGPWGEVRRKTDADGRFREIDWRAFQTVHSVTASDGSVVQQKHNREGWLTEVINENGEEQSFDYDLAGHVLAEISFDGRRHAYRRDPLGRLARYTDPAGRKTDIDRDLRGQIVRREYEDGSCHEFSYDACGRLEKGVSPCATAHYQRDAVGNIEFEEQVIAGRRFTIERKFDGEGRRVGTTSSVGHQAHISRDADGYAIATRLDSITVLQRRDAEGRELERILPEGGKVLSRFDDLGWLVERKVVQPRTLSHAQPDWVGGNNESSRFAFDYDAGGHLLKLASKTQGDAEFTYDAVGRLIQTVRDTSSVEEAFRYDPAGNIVADVAGPRSIAAGNRLTATANQELESNDAGLLTCRREPQPDGSTCETRYEWNAAGMLTEVHLPDGRQVRYQYDFIGRRVLRELFHEKPTPDEEAPERTYYVWDGLRLLHEVETSHGLDARVRTYHYEDKHRDPIAVRTLEPRGDEDKWRFHVVDHTGAVLQLIRPDGAVVWEQKRLGYELVPIGGIEEGSLWGLAGQQFDQDTQLSYNWFRFYDPRLGRYISPDFFELSGGINVFSYGPNPLLEVDLYGLTHFLLDAYVEGRDGSRRPVPRFDSTQTGRQYEGVLEQMRQVAGQEEASEALRRQACHTEQKESWEVVNGEAAHQIQEGETLVMEGTEPPCTNCKGAMNRLAYGKKCNVEYRWRDENGAMQSWNTNPRSAARSASVRRWRQAGML